MDRKFIVTTALLLLASSLIGCRSMTAAVPFCSRAIDGHVALAIQTASGRHCFQAEPAVTPEQQARGLMFRTDIDANSAMLFSPYPGDGGPPREASFWMKDTPRSLDIIFIRADGAIAAIGEETTPFSETRVSSGEPVSAVLEIMGGRAAQLGIREGDKVSWVQPVSPKKQ